MHEHDAGDDGMIDSTTTTTRTYDDEGNLTSEEHEGMCGFVGPLFDNFWWRSF